MGVELELVSLRKWGIPYESPFVISGPCSAESPEQVMETVRGLARYPVHLLRAGIWKPRTRPGSFEGVGPVGLSWLKQAGDAVGLPVTVEVATPEHLEQALKHGIDVLWIGARTTGNPFAVQDVADALQGVDIPVMVKNPMSPDIALWIGALERVNRAGITRLAAIHRGFCSIEEKLYRNTPEWRIPIELKRRLPDLPMICDPSHICGRVDLLLGVAQKAMELLFDGLMLEAHIHPEQALSDAAQQVTPDQLGDLLKQVKLRRTSSDDPQYLEDIDLLRKTIDDVDGGIIDLLARRMEISRQIGLCKKKNNIAILQPERWKRTLADRIAAGKAAGLSELLMLRLYQYIHEESIRNQEAVNPEEAPPPA